jgi:hypothetical protein
VAENAATVSIRLYGIETIERSRAMETNFFADVT